MVVLCSTNGAETNLEHVLKKCLLSLIKLQKVNEQLVVNPYNYRGAPTVTPFICLASSCTDGVWQLLDRAIKSDVRLVELEYPSLKKMQNVCSGRVPIYIHPCFYRAIKLRFLLDVGCPEMTKSQLRLVPALSSMPLASSPQEFPTYCLH